MFQLVQAGGRSHFVKSFDDFVAGQLFFADEFAHDFGKVENLVGGIRI